MIRCMAIAGAMLCLAACSTFDRQVHPGGAPRTFAAAPYLHTGRWDVIQYDLATLLGATPSGDPGQTAQGAELAFARFEALDSASAEARRNEVVGALLLASDRNCDIYMENLRGAQASWRTGLSVSNVLLGAAGPMFSDGGTAGVLSGLSGAAGGLSGKLDEGLMGGMAANVILTGVRAGRAPLRLNILGRFDEDYSAWPVSVAVADVMEYHGRCNVISGLTAAQKATEEALETAEQLDVEGGGGGSV